MNHNRTILIAGATGYVGGRLIRTLEAEQEQVRCLTRRPEALHKRVTSSTEIVKGDLSDPASLVQVFHGVDVAYYLVHSLGNKGDFEAEEARTAQHFAAAAKEAGVSRIIYLGALCDPAVPPSSHLRSRIQVGEILRASGIETIEFRSSIIIGSGSLSFELIRALMQRLPVMVTPRWVSVQAQPIAIEDVLSYLASALELPAGSHRSYEIGGADCMSYRDLMKEYGRVVGLHRIFIPVPVFTPWLSSLWLGLITPVFASIGRRLIESVTTPSVVLQKEALQDFDIRPCGVHDAIVHALRKEDQEFSETHWADALSTVEKPGWGGVAFGNRLVDSRCLHVDVSPEVAFAVIQRIGGKTGWYYGDWLWFLRGLLDRAVGGVGIRRGRRDPEHLRLGDVVDCWRVEVIDSPRQLTLAAEMRVPGRAWLQFEVEPDGDGVMICQTAEYDPVGLIGLVYWYSLYIVHQFVFDGMLKGIAQKALETDAYRDT
ncbi:MAG: DUF2867 domain-containing protein [Candidatus Hydrogenedentes bacterium]|nr:DUF2867 domain-containing protein [Candidatus Hydrogenedentota bacterium]